jgi:hypothetical protein
VARLGWPPPPRRCREGVDLGLVPSGAAIHERLGVGYGVRHVRAISGSPGGPTGGDGYGCVLLKGLGL